MQTYHTICLIIDSDKPYQEHYKSQRNIWKLYMNLDPEIKCYFLRSDPNISNIIDVDEKTNTIFVKSEESFIPGILFKTLKGMEYVFNHFNFKYLIRTNISSFWDFKIFKKNFTRYSDNIVKAPIGYHFEIPYPGGSGIIISKNIVNLMINNQEFFNYEVFDDISIGLFLNKYNINITNDENNRILFEKKINIDSITEYIGKFYTYRIKYDRAEQDKNISLTLAKNIYNL